MSNGGLLSQLLGGIVGGGIRVVDLTMTLQPDVPTIVMPPEFGQSWPFRMEEISRYDHRGPFCYWNNLSCGEHTGTHFDAPIHWVSGKDLPENATDTIPTSVLAFDAHGLVPEARPGGLHEHGRGRRPYSRATRKPHPLVDRRTGRNRFWLRIGGYGCGPGRAFQCALPLSLFHAWQQPLRPSSSDKSGRFAAPGCTTDHPASENSPGQRQSGEGSSSG